MTLYFIHSYLLEYLCFIHPPQQVISDTKEAVNAAWKAGTERVSTIPGSGLVSSTYTTGKGIVSSGSACVKATYDGTVRRIGEGYTDGKTKLSSGYTTGKEYVVIGVKASSGYVAETRVAKLVGSSVSRVLSTTDSVVDYILPEEEEAKEDGEREAEDETVVLAPEAAGNVECARKISRKLRRRMHRRALARVQTATRYYKELLDMLKAHTELVGERQRPLTVSHTRVVRLHARNANLCTIEVLCASLSTCHLDGCSCP